MTFECLDKLVAIRDSLDTALWPRETDEPSGERQEIFSYLVFKAENYELWGWRKEAACLAQAAWDVWHNGDFLWSAKRFMARIDQPASVPEEISAHIRAGGTRKEMQRGELRP